MGLLKCKSCLKFFKPLTGTDKLSLGLSSASVLDNVCMRCIRKKQKKKKTKIVINKDFQNKKKTVCTICLNEIYYPSKWDMLSKGKSTVETFPQSIKSICGHEFHSKCILKWLNEN